MKVVVLTGAGISAESGLSTFRDSGGLWENHPVEDVATPEAFAANPELVHRFYNARRAQLSEPSIQPNAAHTALARLEQKLGDDFILVTQNVDNLHQKAGSQRVLPMHGELSKSVCSHCQYVTQVTADLDIHSNFVSCNQTAGLRSNIVFFGERLHFMDEIHAALSNCAIFASIGTSGNPYPAAGFVELANQAK